MKRILTPSMWFFVAALLCFTLLPRDIVSKIPLVRASHLFFISAFLIVTKLVILFRSKQASHWFVALSPFLLLFLWSATKYAEGPCYRFGADDSFYYAYLSSLAVDGDFDFTNQYRESGLEEFVGKKFWETRTSTGRLENDFPVGASILWTPFFLIGHIEAKLLGPNYPATGYSEPYVNALILANLFYSFAGLFLAYRFLTFYFSRSLSMLSSIGIWITSMFYFYSNPILASEALSFFVVALLLYLCALFRDNWNNGRVLLIGILCGLATTVRFQNIVFALIPVAILASGKMQKRWFVVFVTGCIAGFLPQIIAWKVIYGGWLVNVPGEFLLWWKNPMILETLFSSRKGLFAWHPILLIAAAGLFFFVRKQRMLWVAFLMILVACIYLSSAINDWWGSDSFGARRFVPCLPIFIAGFAAFSEALVQRWKKVGYIAIVSLVLFFAGLNLHLEELFRNGRIDHSQSIQFSSILTGWRAIYRPVVYAMEFPVQCKFAIRYGMPLYHPDNEYVIGGDILYLQKLHANLIVGDGSPLFGPGWQKRETIRNNVPVRLTDSNTAVLRIPMYFKDKPNISMKALLIPENFETGVQLEFLLNGEFLRSVPLPSEGNVIELRISRKHYEKKLNELTMRVTQEQGRTPVLVLRALEFAITN